MDPIELVARITSLNSWMQANAPRVRADIPSRQVKLLRDAYDEFKERMDMVMPPGNPCTHCKGSGLAGDA